MKPKKIEKKRERMRQRGGEREGRRERNGEIKLFKGCQYHEQNQTF